LIAWETQAKLLIKNIWQIMLQLWQTWNGIVYQEDSTIACEQQIDKLQTRVVRCYEIKHKLKANEWQQWFGTNLAEKLCEEPANIIRWVTMVERLIRITKREQRAGRHQA
jgi:hypothetical protein